MKKQLLHKFSFCLFFCLSIPSIGFAQANANESANTSKTYSLQSPYHTIFTHLHYLQPETYYPDLSGRTLYGIHNAPKAQELAIHLKRILDGKGLYVKMETLPKDRNHIDSTAKRSIYTLFPEELPEVYVEKIGSKWYYSQETVEAIPRLYQQTFPFGNSIHLDFVQSDTQPSLFGIKMSQYAIFFALLLLVLMLHVLLRRLFRFFIDRMASTRFGKTYIKKDLTLKAASALSLVVVTQLFIILLPLAQLPVSISKYLIIALKIMSTAFVVVFVLRMLDIFVVYSSKVVERTENTLDDQLLPLIRTILQGIVAFLGFVYILQVLGINITALLAGISIGGLAIALAAQDTVKNLFGSLMIFIDRPFQIGDWISFKGYDGQVESVGLRSTRVRTFSNSLLYVPNATFTDTVVNNVGMRIYRRFKTNLQIPYNTPPELIEKFVEGVRAILREHPATKDDATKVFLNSMDASALNILMVTFFHVPGWDEELKAKQEIVLSLLKLARILNISYAHPTNITQFDTTNLQEVENLNLSSVQTTLDGFLADWRKQMNLRTTHTGDNMESLGNEEDA